MTPAESKFAKAVSHLGPFLSEGRENAATESMTNDARTYADVLGVKVDALNMSMALERIESALNAGRKGYVCMTGVHGIMEAQRHLDVRRVLANAFMCLPDGMPMVWVGRSQECSWMQRVAGPDLMLRIFGRKDLSRFTHFLYGGNEGVAEQLSQNLMRRFPWARIVGTYTPPFRALTIAEEQQLVSQVRSVKPSIIWVGISSPRQEMFMARYLPLLETTLMFGVGAAFDYHTGRIKDCADWVKLAGLQWLHRLAQDPRRLLWRYMRNNPAFMWKIALRMLRDGTTAMPAPHEDTGEKRALACESTAEY